MIDYSAGLLDVVIKNFDPDNYFHVAIKTYGEGAYKRAILHATEMYKADIENGVSPVILTENIRLAARKILKDDNMMRGFMLDDDLGI